MMVGDFHLPGSDFQPKKRMGVGRVSSFKTPGIDKVGFEDSSKLVTTLRSFVGLYGKLCGLLACDCSYKFPFRFIGLVCFFQCRPVQCFFFSRKASVRPEQPEISQNGKCSNLSQSVNNGWTFSLERK